MFRRKEIKELKQTIYLLRDELLSYTNPLVYKAKKEIEQAYTKDNDSDKLIRNIHSDN